MSANIVDLSACFPSRLKILREERFLTQSDLAERAGLHPRSVRELELGRRERALCKTIMLLAEALDMTFDELVNGQTSTKEHTSEIPPTQSKSPSTPTDATPSNSPPPHHYRLRRIIYATVSAIALAGAILVIPEVTGYEIHIDELDGVVEVRDDLFGRLNWRRAFSDEIQTWRIAPWDDDVLLVGLAAHTAEGGRLLALDCEDGSVLWDIQPDLETMAQAFVPEFVYRGGFHCQEILDVDLDGDGEVELVIHFTHVKWYPSAICVVDCNGVIESQYASRGRVYDIHAEDIDNDGRDELVCAATNNTPEYQGASLFILDDLHRSGASIDPVTSPDHDVPDSALVRIVIPAWPDNVMKATKTTRITATDIFLYVGEEGGLQIQADIGAAAIGGFVLDFDIDLRPISAKISDALLSSFEQAGIDDFRWTRAWLDGHLRFEAGQLMASPRAPTAHIQ